MKKGIWTAFALLCLLFAGCAEEVPSASEEVLDTDDMQVGFFVKCSLVGMSLKSPVQDGSAGEDIVGDINLYLVNEMGDVVESVYLSGNDGDGSEDGNDDDRFRISANIQKWKRYSVYALANAGRQMPAASLEELENMEYAVVRGDSGSGVLMAGKTEPQLLYNGTVVWIKIERCISRIILKADYKGLNDDVEIDVKSISLKNVPNRVKVFGSSRIEDPEFSIEGEKVVEISRESLQQGVVFYQYENLQGTLQPENGDCTKKVWPQESLYSKICSYVEMEASYSSPRKRGDILYRFYLGSDMTSNYDVVRNTSQTVTVSFNGDGGVDENTWRVDRSDISNLVTDVAVTPSVHRFIEYGAALHLDVGVSPEDAAEKRVSFRSTDASVATVDDYGNVVSVGEGECMIIAESCDGTGLSDTCRIVVANPAIAFADKGRVMYDGEIVRVLYDVIKPAGIDAELLLSNDNAQIISSDPEGFTVMATTPGVCVVTARVGSATARYELDIRKLSIELKEKSGTAYNHFYYDFEYVVTPEHAAGLGVSIAAGPEISRHVQFCGGNRILVSVDGSHGYPDGVYNFTVGIDGRGDVSDNAEIVVRESSLADVKMVPNLNSRSSVANLDFSTSPRAFASMDAKCSAAGVDFVLESDRQTVTVPSPCRLNGRYDVEFTAVGDDGQQVTIDAGLEIYEAVYVVAVSKPVSMENISFNPDVVEYINEVELKVLSYPGSFLFGEGELAGNALPPGVTLPDFEYILDGKTYSDMVPDVSYTYRFTFRHGEEYLEFPSGTYVYDGKDVPDEYMDFYSIDILQPWAVLSGNRYIYFNNRTFGGGFCDRGTDWTEILDIVYWKK